MRQINYDPSTLLPGVKDWYVGNTFVDKEINKLRVQRVQNYIKDYYLDVGYPGTTDNDFEIPCIQKADPIIPKRLLDFTKIKDATPEDGIHFYCDDFVYRRFMNNRKKYIEQFRKVKCVIAFDLSSYYEFRLPIVQNNIYLNRIFTQELQKNGIPTIPVAQWRDEKSYAFCFLGIPKGSAISISSIGSKANSFQLRDWENGLTECIRQIDPASILFYGDPVEFDFQGRDVHWYPNENIKRMRNYGR